MGLSNVIRKADVAYRIPETWANRVLGYLPQYTNLIRTVNNDFSQDEIARYGDTVNIQKRGTLSANSKGAGDDVTRQRPTETEVEVSLDSHYEVTFAAEDVARALSKTTVLDGYIEDAAKVLAEKVEDSLAALYASAGDTVTGVTSSNVVTKFTEARRKLITAKVPQNEPMFAYMSEYAVEDLLNDDILKDASKIGQSRPLIEGAIGRMRSFDVFESQVVNTSGSPSTYHNMFYTKDSMALVTRPLPQDAEEFGGAKQAVVTDPQTGFSMRVTMSYNANALAPQITLDCIWGVSVLRSEHLIDVQSS